jgi:uncharacterized protein (TIGR03067 family)
MFFVARVHVSFYARSCVRRNAICSSKGEPLVNKLLLGVLAVLLLGSDSPKGYDAATEMDPMEGSWMTVAGERDGVAFRVAQSTETMCAGKYTTTNGMGEVTDRGTYHLDLTRKPFRLEETPAEGPRKGTTIRYVIQIDGDRLKVGYKDDGTESPGGFNEANTILTCKRVKK